MDLVASKSFTTVIQDEGGTLPFIPDVPNGDGSYHTQLFEDQILPYLMSKSSYAPRDGSNFLSLDKLIIPGDVYSSGQNLLGAMQMVPLLLQVAQDPGVPSSDRTLANSLPIASSTWSRTASARGSPPRTTRRSSSSTTRAAPAGGTRFWPRLGRSGRASRSTTRISASATISRRPP